MHINKKIYWHNFFKKKAFTLAEVLITLGIIGIVAAMTIPTLISNYQKSQVLGQIKSTYAQLNNAIQMATVEYGTDINQWYIPYDTAANATKYFVETYLLPNLKTISVCGADTSSACLHLVKYLNSSTNTYISGYSNGYAFTMANGCMVEVMAADLNGPSVADVRVQVFFDVNGKNKPNILGKDAFIVELGGAPWQANVNKNKFMPYGWAVGDERTDYTNFDGTNCDKTTGNGQRCLGLIMYDGWQIKDDYPW